MEKLSFKADVSSPSVEFDPVTGLLQIGGESYPENSFEFYAPVIAWLRGFLAETKGAVKLRVSLSYLNTSSTKCMIDMLDDLEAAHSRGLPVEVEWLYDEDNERAKDTIDEFKEDFTMPFAVIAVKE